MTSVAEARARAEERDERGRRERFIERLSSSWWTGRVVLAIVMPPLVYFALRPERYGLVPNGGDPVFYTGYAINFDDVMRELGDGRYFVTRWTTYLPSRLVAEIFGLKAGRLLLRWLVASLLLLSLLHLGRRWRWTLRSAWVISMMVLANPLMARAFLTDYFEWVIVSLGTILVAQSLEQRSTYVRSALIGILASSILISNPVVVVVAVPPMFVYAAGSWTRRERVVAQSAVMLGSFIGVFVAGLLLFRIRYGIDNVYQPTIDFMRFYAGFRDPHKSPRLEWLEVYLWLYTPIVITAVCLLVEPARVVFRRSRTAQILLGLLIMEYCFQWLDQFVRDGLSLEISYYWSPIAPATFLCLAVILGVPRWSLGAVVLFTGGWVAVLAFPRVSDLTLPRVWWYLPISAVVVAACILVGRRSGAGAAGLAVLWVLLSYSVAPAYDPTAYHRYNDSPQFGSAFFVAGGSKGDLDLDEIIWLENTLDELPDDSDLYFAPSTSAVNITSVYVPHVTGHLFRSAADGLSDDDRRTIDLGVVPRIAIYGDDSFVETTLGQLSQAVPASTTSIDVIEPGRRHRRLVVLEFDRPSDGFSWNASIMLGRTGRIVGTERVALPAVDEPGFVLFGPRVPLADVRYRATVTYRVPGGEATDDVVGTFDVAQSGTSVGHREMPAVAANGEVSIDFDGRSGGFWEFRVLWSGTHALSIASVRVEVLS